LESWRAESVRSRLRGSGRPGTARAQLSATSAGEAGLEPDTVENDET
jgi:hypothetical protein